jgi:hypothetical protein
MSAVTSVKKYNKCSLYILGLSATLQVGRNAAIRRPGRSQSWGLKMSLTCKLCALIYPSILLSYWLAAAECDKSKVRLSTQLLSILIHRELKIDYDPYSLDIPYAVSAKFTTVFC